MVFCPNVNDYLADHTSIVPKLRLNGCRLEQAGFGSASYASITVMDGLLIIRKSTGDPNP